MRFLKIILPGAALAASCALPLVAAETLDLAARSEKVAAISSALLSTAKPGLWSRSEILHDALGGEVYHKEEKRCIARFDAAALDNPLNAFADGAAATECSFDKLAGERGKFDLAMACKVDDSLKIRSAVAGSYSADKIDLTSDMTLNDDNPMTTKLSLVRNRDCTAAESEAAAAGIAIAN